MISDDAKLIKGNYGNKGYFRVNYDPESWKAIAAQLNNDHEVIKVHVLPTSGNVRFYYFHKDLV